MEGINFKIKVAAMGGYLCFLLLLSGCIFFQEEENHQTDLMNSEGTVISKTAVWKTNLSNGKHLIGTFMSPLIHDKIVVTGAIGESDNDWYLAGLDTYTGEIVWKWSDQIIDREWYEDAVKIGYTMIKISGDFEDYSGTFLYAIDLRNGQTIWKDLRVSQYPCSQTPETNDQSYYFVELGLIPKIFRGSVSSNVYEEITTVPIDSIRTYQNIFGVAGNLKVFNGSQGHDYLIISFNEYQLEDSLTRGKMFAGLFDLTTNTYIYEKALIAPYSIGFFSQKPEIYDNRVCIFNVNDQMVGVDLYTGEVLWRRGYDQGTFSYLIVEGVLVLGQFFGADTYAYGLDPMTGHQLWRIPSGGGASEMQALNGVVYWKDRGDGKLYAVEATTGKLLWKLNDPDPESNSWWKSDGVAVMAGKNGEKGRVFASTHLRMYCYEAAR
jgi:outer membrane protein assembly factor BamB